MEPPCPEASRPLDDDEGLPPILQLRADKIGLTSKEDRETKLRPHKSRGPELKYADMTEDDERPEEEVATQRAKAVTSSRRWKMSEREVKGMEVPEKTAKNDAAGETYFTEGTIVIDDDDDFPSGPEPRASDDDYKRKKEKLKRHTRE